MTELTQSGAAPVTSGERVGELDVLRGFALLGVLIANFVWWAYSDNTALPSQVEAFGADPANLAVMAFVNIFVDDKANTLFAFLFGVGFWVQMQRVEQRGAQFTVIYLRRLFVLLIMGIINLLLIWPWDILNLYALAGFALFALRSLSARTMLIVGVILALVGRPLINFLADSMGFAEPAHEMNYSDAAVAERQEIFNNGSYSEWVGASTNLAIYDWLANGLVLAWFLYALGRFLIGAYVARRGWLQRAGELLPHMRKIFIVALPLGLALETARLVIEETELLDAPSWVPSAMHAVGVPIVDLGYVTGMILLFHSPRCKRIALAFAPVGRMALTNYLVQGVFIGLIMFGFHGGLAMSGTIEPKQTLPLCIAFFGLQILFSRWWLARYRFGPMEWLWRTLTYGSRPTMRLQPA